MIVGGGPAGMEAAQICVERGHEVVLYEKNEELGGLLHVASALPDKYDMRKYVAWMIRKTKECGARIVLGQEVTEADIRREAPDAVLLGIGSQPAYPPIPGIRGEQVILAEDADLRRVPIGDTVVIMGAGLTGSECAISLAREGKQVTVIDMIPQGQYDNAGWGSQSWMSILRLHKELSVNVILEAKITEITPEGVVYERNGQRQTQKADTVINALGLKIDEEAVERLVHVVPETYRIGDCFGDKMSIDNAIMTGFTYAMEL
jgi:NADPH-dependent 2,4-dienoyl-CoA reductase/sulfur reductase-like enzyme